MITLQRKTAKPLAYPIVRIISFLTLFYALFSLFFNVIDDFFFALFGESEIYSSTGVLFWAFLAAVISSAIIETLRAGGAWYNFGLRFDRFASRDVLFGLALGLGAAVVVALFYFALGFEAEINNIDLAAVASLFAFYLFVAAFEETLFRGTLFQSLIDLLGVGAAVFLSALIFAISHSSNPNISALGFANIFLAGVIFAVMYLKTKALWLPISFHAFWNFFSALIGSPVSGYSDRVGVLQLNFNRAPDILFGGAFGVEGGLLTTLVMILAAVAAVKKAPASPFTTAALFRRELAESEAKYD